MVEENDDAPYGNGFPLRKGCVVLCFEELVQLDVWPGICWSVLLAAVKLDAVVEVDPRQ